MTEIQFQTAAFCMHRMYDKLVEIKHTLAIVKG